MYKKSFLNIILTLIISLIGLIYTNSTSAINLSISPIKYELESQTWATVIKTAKLTNHTNETLYIRTGKSDFISRWDSWKPIFIRKNEEIFEQELSDWISINVPSFNIGPLETKEISFTINIPDNATPGWHYWAVFFKSSTRDESSWVNIWINVDYGILILLKIDWEINREIEIQEPTIVYVSGSSIKFKDSCPNWDNSWSLYDKKCEKEIIKENWTSKNKGKKENNNKSKLIDESESINENKPTNESELIDENELINENKSTNESESINNNELINEDESVIHQKDDCLVDLTNNNSDWKCIDNVKEIINEITWNKEEINEKISKEEFDIKINIPIENVWNTHVKPKWKIKLIDEKWKEIKRVWKEIITNDAWAIIWEKIVDYIPINDVWGNVLPWTKRIYKSEWKGFPYEVYNENWVKEIKYWTPWEYYTNQNIKEKTFLMPWERISSKVNNKKIKAIFDINYKDENWENIEYNSIKEFDVEYIEKYVWLNLYFFIILWFIVSTILLLMLAFRKKKKICINKKCKKKIDSDVKICQYCETKQNKDKNDKK